MDEVKHTTKNLPVFIGEDDKYVVAKADIFHKPDSVLIQITSDTHGGQRLAEFLEQEAQVLVGLSFVYLPVQNIRERENI